MNRLKKYTLFGIIFVLITGTLSHFVYEWTGKSPAAAPFFPINESTWEHMKLVFFPAVLYGIFMHLNLKKEFPCITSAVPAGILTGTLSVPVLFYTYTGILGFHTFVLDIAVFILSVLAVFAVIYFVTRSCRVSSSALLYTLTAIMAAAFIVFSFRAPSLGIFSEPDTEITYEVKETK